jgi:hypothetical protein
MLMKKITLNLFEQDNLFFESDLNDTEIEF